MCFWWACVALLDPRLCFKGQTALRMLFYWLSVQSSHFIGSVVVVIVLGNSTVVGAVKMCVLCRNTAIHALQA